MMINNKEKFTNLLANKDHPAQTSIVINILS